MSIKIKTDGGCILHFIQRPFRFGWILIRSELVIQAFSSISFSGLMVSQYGAVFVSLRVGICPPWPVVDDPDADLKVLSQFFNGKFFGSL